ncbi:amino acid adenylation domain-containing protein [Pedobacter sp. AW31-3R]|uniref:amino acid adenylation domain-containing protein n=1 Tax=Pedobacter sp. AW31-3R TaxID=3445781 RepID=UPI003FA04176
MREFLSLLRKKDVHLKLENGELTLTFPKTGLDPALLNEIKSQKAALISYLSELNKEESYKAFPAVSGTATDYVLSSSQRRLWVLNQLDPDTVAYNMPGFQLLEGALDEAAFEKSFSNLIEHHEILRTVFKENSSAEIRQYILKPADSGFVLVKSDLRSSADQENEVQALVQQELRKPFNLAEGPLIRAALYRLDEQKWLFSYTMHHIISDGWSMGVLISELLGLYNAYTQGLENPYPPLRIQYKDYAVWQQEQLSGDALTLHKNYWLDQFSGELPVLTLPANQKRPLVKTYNGGVLNSLLAQESTEGIKKLSQEQGCTLFMGLLAVVKAWLYHYSGQDDIIIGSPIAGREHVELEGQIGFYVNTLALRSRFQPADSFRDLLQQVRKVTLGAYEHQVYPFDQLVDELKLQRDMSRNVLFDVMVALHASSSGTNRQALNGLEVSVYRGAERLSSKFDLSFNFYVTEEGVKLGIEYNKDIYSATLVSHFAVHFQQLMTAVLAAPDQPLGRLDWLNASEKLELLETFNDTRCDYPRKETLISLFEKQVQKRGGQTALVFESNKLRYDALNEAANRLCNYLMQQHSIKRGDLVGICMSRCENQLIAILAVLKCAAAYVPVDPEYPQERIDYIKQDSNCKVLIDASFFSAYEEVKASYPAVNPTVQPGPEDLAYVIYTSGSTGQPKGVMVEHTGVVNRIEWMWKAYDFSAADVILQKANYTFDVSVWEIFMPLCWGTKMILCHKDDVGSPIRIAALIAKEKVTCMHFVPSMFDAFINSEVFDQEKGTLDSLHKIITSGEALSPETVRRWFTHSNVPVYNLYGPTEASIDVTYFNVYDGNNTVIPIGKPIANTQLYILNTSDGLCPVGVTGEIVIAGTGLARGYLNKPELTAEKFVANPFKPGERMYRTGDLGRWLEDGNIEFIGRKDDQVKVRGYRIELGEVEHAFRNHADISAAVVLVSANVSGENDLIAYIACSKELEILDLRLFLGKQLPAYMVPNHFVFLDEIPLNANGKADRKSLKAIGIDHSGTDGSYRPPRNQMEEVLVSVYEEVLKVKNIGINQNFFVLGGDSIKAIQLVSRLKQHGYTLNIGDVLRYPVIEELLLNVDLSVQGHVIDQQEVQGLIPLSPIQQAFLENETVDKHHFNLSVMLVSAKRIDEEILSKSLNGLIAHHDALRIVFRQTAEGYVQENTGLTGIKIHEVIADEEDQLIRAESDLAHAGFDLQNGPLFKVILFKGSQQDHLLFIAHHLVIDGVSWRVLLPDFAQLYESHSAGRPAKLPLKTDSFQSWMNLMQQYAFSNELEKELPYWDEIEALKVPALPVDDPAASNLVNDANSKSFLLNAEQTSLLLGASGKAYGTNVNDLLITAVGMAFRKCFDINQLCLALEGHGREDIGGQIDVTRTVGWFTAIYPVVIDVSFPDDNIRQLIEVKERLHRIPNKGIGYGVLRYLQGRPYQMEPEIVFNYLGVFDTEIKNEHDDPCFKISGAYHGQAVSPNRKRDYTLEISAMIVEGRLKLSLIYSARQYNAETITRLLQVLEQELSALIEKTAAEEQTQLTPVDLTFKGLNMEQLLKLNELQ